MQRTAAVSNNRENARQLILKRREAIRKKNRERIKVFAVGFIFSFVLCIGFILFQSASGKSEDRFEVVMVQSGDTLWSIANKYKPQNMDTRSYINNIMEKNNMTTADVYENQGLFVQVFE